MQNDRPSLEEIIDLWIDDYKPRFPNSEEERKAAFLELLVLFRNNGYAKEEVNLKSVKDKIICGPIIPDAFKKSTRNAWYQGLQRVLGVTITKFYSTVNMSGPTEEDLAKLTKTEKASGKLVREIQSDIPKETEETREPVESKRHGEELDRSIFKDMPAPKIEWDMNVLNDLGIDPEMLGVKTDE